MRKIIGAICIVVGVAIFFGTLMDNFISFGDDEGKRKAKSVNLSGVNVVALDFPSAEVNVLPGKESQQLEVEMTGHGAANHEWKIDKDGEVLEVEVEGEWFDWFNFFFNDFTINVYVPENYHENLVLDVDSGNIDITGSSKAKPLRLNELTVDTNSGNMDMKYLNLNKWQLDVSSGSLEGSYITAAQTDIDISSGNLELQHFSGSLQGELSSGNIEAQFDQLTGPINLDVSSGRVELDIPEHTGFTLNANVSSGDVDCDFPLKRKQTGDDDLRGVHGTGEHKIELEVSSGKISIY